MIGILFICHGNICRSPMAEFVMKDLARKAGLEGAVRVASAATSTEEIGNPVYPPARRKLAEHQIGCAGKTARQLREEDYQAYDYLVGMDHANLRNMRRMLGGDPEGTLSLLLSTPGVRGRRAPTPGLPETLKSPTRTSWRGVRGCWIRSEGRSIHKAAESPGRCPGSLMVKQRIKSGELHKIRLWTKICRC